eukprot:TRINITY_DN1342_c0_g1_i3.p1 TRINITY_DN1342_c0_g1~~TRINITY_DN1342_c0_g1_i3.p1  ORF type:complete len:668 (+),score=120.20 TRINITY_DN1342_c0_g1_i3:133-2136(+)
MSIGGGLPTRGRRVSQEDEEEGTISRKGSKCSDSKLPPKSSSKTRKSTRTASLPRRSSSRTTSDSRNASLTSRPSRTPVSNFSTKAEVEALQTKLAEADEKNKNWAALTEKLKQEYYTAMQQWGDMEQSVQKTQEEIGRKRRQEIKNLEQTLEEEREKRRAAEEKLMLNGRDKDDLIADMRKQEATLMGDLRQTRQQNDEHSSEIERLRLEISTSQKLLTSRDKDFEVQKTLEAQKRELLISEHRQKEDLLKKAVEEAQQGQQYQLRRFKELKERYLLKKKAHTDARQALTEGSKELVELKIRLGTMEAAQQAFEIKQKTPRLEYNDDKWSASRSGTPDKYKPWAVKSKPRIRWTSHSPPALRSAVPFCATVKGATPPLHILDNGPSKYTALARDAPAVDHSFRWVPPPSLRAYFEDERGNKVLHPVSRTSVPITKNYEVRSQVRSRSVSSGQRRTGSPQSVGRGANTPQSIEVERKAITPQFSDNGRHRVTRSPPSEGSDKPEVIHTAPSKVELETIDPVPDPVESPKTESPKAIVNTFADDTLPMDVESVAPPDLPSPPIPVHRESVTQPPLPPRASVDAQQDAGPSRSNSISPAYSRSRSASPRRSFSSQEGLETHSDTTSIMFHAETQGSVVDKTENDVTEVFSLDTSSSRSEDGDTYSSSSS